MIRLSVLVCSVMSRRNTFLPNILDMLHHQYEALSPDEQGMVEILCLLDNQKMMLGDKRNQLVNVAQGTHVVFVDDDDRIAPRYLAAILQALRWDPDVITFQASV